MTEENKQPEDVTTEAPVAEAPVVVDVPVEQPASEVPATEAPAADVVAAKAPAKPGAGARPFFGRGRGGAGGGAGGNRRGGPGRPGGRPKNDMAVESDYEEKNVEVARVTRVTKGGKRMRFRTLSVIGNRKGRAGFGLAKGLDVAASTAKATAKARKSLFTVPLVNDSIPHMVEAKFAAAHVLLKPAPKGTGVKAGGSVRIVLELAGVPNVVSKALGSKNKINNVKATFLALRKLRLPPAPKTDAAQ